jgi:hypothetical protein
MIKVVNKRKTTRINKFIQNNERQKLNKKTSLFGKEKLSKR